MPEVTLPDNQAPKELLRLLHESGVGDRSGKLLYSGTNTLRRGPLYVLGFNPGGDSDVETTTCIEHLASLPGRWSEYTCASWRPAGRWCGPGEAKMQKGVRAILGSVGLDPRDVCASNLIFARSRDKNALGREKEDLKKACWKIHEFMLRLIQPRGILAIDNETFDDLRSRFACSPNVESFDAGWGGWVCRATALRIDGRDVRLVGTPNLSRYTPYTPDRRGVIAKLAECLQPCLDPTIGDRATPPS
ncbi:hypothetical protein [Siccirubricoccus sp. G192]|uniref:hypothetical protein n=1 Tax=Siccirubricoccus sp. G192 TaxID=2849651 RepID=UPI001C2C62C4|nr:hypothetical protein [Siccirubricoccus sp. G192]MBV1798414.1 hypothetical protein [Siccirubricoccus sp. G192]